jgi:hypothetical protein
MSPSRILGLYRLVFVTLIIIASAQALVMAHEVAHHVAPLATAEIAGALMLSWRKTQLAGAGLLVCVFAGAEAVSIVQGIWPTHFLQYAACAICIVMLDRTIAAQG